MAIYRDPNDSESKRALKKLLRSELEYSLHELPDGVLYGHNSATIESLDEMRHELAEFIQLENSTEEEDTKNLIDACMFHYKYYQKYLETRERWGNYSNYLESEHGSLWPDIH